MYGSRAHLGCRRHERRGRVQQEVRTMRIRNLAVAATLIPVLMLPGCDTDTASGATASAPGAQKAAKHGLTDEVASQGDPASDPVVNAYYNYRVALDQMMRSGGSRITQLVP